MHLNLRTSDTIQLEFSEELHKEFAFTLLQGFKYFASKSENGSILIQELCGKEYELRLLSGNVSKKIHADNWINKLGLYCIFVLKNQIRKKISSFGKINIRENHYISFLAQKENCSGQLVEQKDFKVLEVFYSPKILKQFAALFPKLKEKLKTGNIFLFQPKSNLITSSIKETLYQIQTCRFDPSIRDFYYELKVKELLYYILQDTKKENYSDLNFTPFEIARINQARKYLEDHIDKKPPTIKTLSRRVAINEFKLKKGFRQYFNSGISEWVTDRKMELARDLLLTTNEPIKMIAAKVGYPRTTNFITAFRKKFGTTPGSLRRQ